MASPATRMRTGSFISTNASINVDAVGFEPARVELFNETSLAQLKWSDTLDDDAGIKQVAAGTTTLQTSAGITPRAGGFTVGAMADINDTTTEKVHWVAWEK